MKLKVFGAVLAIAVIAGAAGIAGWAYGRDDDSEAQAVAPTARPQPSLSPFCASISAYFEKADAATAYFNASLAPTPISQFGQSTMTAYRDQVRAANNLAIILPPSGAPAEAQALYEVIRAHQTASDRQASAVFGRDAALLRTSIDAKNAARREADAYFIRLC